MITFFLVQLHVAMAFSDALFATSYRYSEKKGPDIGEFSRCSASTGQEPESANQNL